MNSPNSAEAAVDPLQLLQHHFGHAAFREGQLEVIQRILDGQSALACFPTGSGKSLCYQLPALTLDGVTLVVSPLIALMKDQVESLTARGIAAARLDSTLTADEAFAIYEQLSSGELRLLFIAPERLGNAGFQRRLREVKIALLAVDEAHCLSEWGHNFRPDYLKLTSLVKELGIPQVLALTATATPRVASQILERFAIPAENEVRTGFARPNLTFRVQACTRENRDGSLIEKLKRREGFAPTIIYVTLQRTAEQVAGTLRASGIQASAYHAGMRAEDRAELQDAFMADEVETIVATIAFGMGVDKPNVRHIFHYNLPKSLENYLQEAGRAGRDGLPSTCEIVGCPEDRFTLENFIFGDTPSASALRSFTHHMLTQGERFSISRYDLGVSLDIRSAPLATALTYLEMYEVLRPLGPYYAEFQVRLLRSFPDVLAAQSPGERDFLEKLFQVGKEGRTWITFPAEEIADQLGVETEKIMGVLDGLDMMGHARVKATRLRHRYELGPNAPEYGATTLKEIAQDLIERFHSHESRELERLGQVYDYLACRSCLPQYLGRYFGHEEPACGICTVCAEADTLAPIDFETDEADALSLNEVDLIRATANRGEAALKTPRQIARFLCGITSPATTRARLTRDENFGLLDERPFSLVLSYAESLG